MVHPAYPRLNFCVTHQRFEPIPERYYRLCYECRHVFLTAEELITKDTDMRRSVIGRAVEPLPADQIAICPECTHDL